MKKGPGSSVCAGLALLSASAAASPEYFDVLTQQYKLGENSRIVGKSCAVCHVSEEDFSLNLYGKDVKGQLKEAGAELTAANLTAVEGDDSDADGATNGDELKADSLPGDAKSFPEGHAPAAPAPEQKEKAKPLVPKNAFHPALVHFPIGLFIFGLCLDFFGMLSGRKELLLAGWYNLVAAAVTGLAGILTGFGAFYFMKFPLKGIVLNHLLLATGSVVVMWILAGMRLHRHEQMRAGPRAIYYLLALAALIAISYGGHLGGVMVYGE